MPGIVDGKRVLIFAGEDGLGADARGVLTGEGARVWLAGPGGDEGNDGHPGRVPGIFERAAAELGGLDTVVNAATRWWVGAPEDVTDDTWSDLATVNGAAALAIIQETLRRIPGPGSLTVITHVWAMGTSPEMGVAGAARAALGPLIKAAAYRGAGRGLRVNGVAIGIVDSPYFRTLVSERAAAVGAGPEEAFGRVTGRTAMGRAGTGAEIGKAVAFLASDHARAITGVTVVADGGLLYA
jgi:3-oxoacyl-[acyl-carrier protein] reductase